MKTLFLTFCICTMSLVNLYSQDKEPGNWISYLHFESGLMYPNGSISENIAIRQNLSSYYIDQVSNGNIYSDTYGLLFGLKWEFFNKNLRAGISSGIRYTNFQTEISGYSSANSDFFYLRYSMVNADTKFARVENLTESRNFFSIPLEVRFIPFEYQKFSFFVKAGSELGIFTMLNETHIEFREDVMKDQHDEVLSSMGLSSENFYSTLYGSLGVSYGNKGMTNYIFEIFLPSLFLGDNIFNLTDVDSFSGFKFSIQFPINNSK